VKTKPVIGVSIPCIIIPHKTGIVYFNQVGGYAVHDLEVEGYIIPLEQDYYVKIIDGEKSNCDNPYWSKYNLQEHFDKLFAPLKEETKYNGHGYKGIDLEDVEYLERAFFKTDFLEITIDRERLADCEEAKIYVSIKLSQYNSEGKEIEPLCVDGILTWENSD